MKKRSTLEVAREAGVDKSTLLRWLRSGRLSEPRRRSNGGVTARLWTERDLERVLQYKAARYRKGRGRKKKKA